jgi:hypothetical protein
VAPDPFSPNGDGSDDLAVVTFAPGEGGKARVSVVDTGGGLLRRVTGWRSVPASRQTVEWDGRVSGASGLEPADEGRFSLLVELRDGAGNTSSVRRSVSLDRTLKTTGVSRGTLSPNGDGVGDAVTLSFRLSRAADVTATVARAGSTLRTIRLGRLARGARSVDWGGELGGGGTATSGAYTLRVTADGALGTTSATRQVTVDLTPPRVTSASALRVRYGTTAKLRYMVRDAYSPMVKVSATITDAKGRVVAKPALGWVKQGASHVLAWTPKARRTYTVTFAARDLGGNRQIKTAATKLRVR